MSIARNSVYVLPLYLVVVVIVNVAPRLHDFRHTHQQQVVVPLDGLQSIFIHHIFL